MSGRFIRKMRATGFTFFRRSSTDITDLVDVGLDVVATGFAKPSIGFFTGDALPRKQQVEQKIFGGFYPFHAAW